MSTPPKQNWRQPGGQPQRPRSGTKPVAGAKRWILASFLVLGLTGIILGLFFFRGSPPDPVLLAIPVTQYPDPNWPANPGAESGARAFRSRFGGDSAQSFQIQERAQILRELNQLVDDSRGVHAGRPIVVSLSLLGITTAQGPLLIPADARPGDLAAGLTLEDILQPLRKSSTPRLLILDVQPANHPRTSAGREDVNDLLAQELARLDAAGDLPMIVLLANTPPEGTLILRNLGQSAFGFALAHAAGGAADGWNPSKSRDNRVSARELADATTDYTRFITSKYGTAVQVPRVFGQGEDFRLLPVPDQGPAALPTLPETTPTTPTWLSEAGAYHDRLVAEGFARRVPRLAFQFRLALRDARLRVDQGEDPAPVQVRLTELKNQVQAVESATRLAPLPELSVSARPISSFDAKTRDELAAALRPLFERIRNSTGGKPEDYQAAMQALWAKPPEAASLPALAFLIWEFAGQLDQLAQLETLNRLAQGYRPKFELMELQTLDLLVRLPASITKRWPAKTVPNLIRLISLREDVIRNAEPFTAWLMGAGTARPQAPLSRADHQYRAILAALTDDATDDAPLAEAIESIEPLIRDLLAIRDAVRVLAEAQREIEETRAVLSDLALDYPDDLAPLPEVVQKDWQILVDNTERLGSLLLPPKEHGLPAGEEITTRTAAIRSARRALLDRLRLPDPATPRQLQQLSQWPLLTERDYQQLRGVILTQDRQKMLEILMQWPKEPQADTRAVTRSSPRAHQQRRTQRLFDVLRLAGLATVTQRISERTALGSEPTEEQWLTWANSIQSDAMRAMPRHYRDASAETAARIGWAIHPWDLPAVPREGLDYRPNPEPEVARRQRAQFVHRLGEERYRADAVALRRPGRDYIPAVAREFAETVEQRARQYLDWKP